MFFEDYEQAFARKEQFEIGPKRVSEEEMLAFAKRYDPRPFHLEDAAMEETPYPKVIASGYFTLCFAWSQWVKTEQDAAGIIVGIGLDELRWHKPVYAGDFLHSKLWIKDLRRSRSKPDRGTVRLHFSCRNQEEEEVLSMDALYLVKCREQKK